MLLLSAGLVLLVLVGVAFYQVWLTHEVLKAEQEALSLAERPTGFRGKEIA